MGEQLHSATTWPLPRRGSAAPHLISLHLGEDLEQPGDVRGGPPNLPVQLEDSEQLILGHFLLDGDATVNCGEEGAWAQSPRLTCSGLAVLPAVPTGVPRLPLLPWGILLPSPHSAGDVRVSGQASSSQGAEGFGRESPSNK